MRLHFPDMVDLLDFRRERRGSKISSSPMKSAGRTVRVTGEKPVVALTGVALTAG